MRGAVAVACALLPFMLFGSRPVAAQEPLRVIRELRFEGNRAIPDEVIASAIATTNSSWFARTFLFRWLGLGEKRYFDEQEFRRDVVRIEVLYRRSGYPHVEIDTLVRRTGNTPSRSDQDAIRSTSSSPSESPRVRPSGW